MEHLESTRKAELHRGPNRLETCPPYWGDENAEMPKNKVHDGNLSIIASAFLSVLA